MYLLMTPQLSNETMSSILSLISEAVNMSIRWNIIRRNLTGRRMLQIEEIQYRGMRHIHGLIDLSYVNELHGELDAVNQQDGEE